MRKLRVFNLPTCLHPPDGKGQSDGTHNDFLAHGVLALYATEGFMKQVQMFSKNRRLKRPRLFLGSGFVWGVGG